MNYLEDRLRLLPRLLAEHLHRPPAVEGEIRAVHGELFEPGPFTTFTHGDPTVGNVLYSSTTGINFVDFETAAYRHALIDGCFARLRYLYSVWAHHIPVSVQHQLLRAYRAELVEGCPAAGDDARFARGLLAASAAWLAALCTHLDRVVEQDARWGRATYRQRIIAGLEHFIALADEYDSLPALRDASRQLLDRLRDSWPGNDRQLATYPALRD